MRGKVVLFYPPYDGPPLSAPLCLLALAATLREADFEAVMIDAAIEPDYRSRIGAKHRDALCLGISVLTGPMIRGAIESRHSGQRALSELPISLRRLASQPAAGRNSERAVCRCGRARTGRNHPASKSRRRLRRHGLAELSHGSRGRATARAAQPRPRVQPLECAAHAGFRPQSTSTPMSEPCGVRKLAYATSVGCPYACNYCTDMVFYKRRFNALSAERVVAEMTTWSRATASKKSRCSIPTFPSICTARCELPAASCDSGVKFSWTFQASTDFLCRMSEDEVRLLGESGVSHMGFGTESTSERC